MFTGKTALVTGSASGIGLGIARTLAAQSANLILNGFGDKQAVEQLCAEMSEREGVQVRYDGTNLSNSDGQGAG